MIIIGLCTALAACGPRARLREPSPDGPSIAGPMRPAWSGSLGGRICGEAAIPITFPYPGAFRYTVQVEDGAVINAARRQLRPLLTLILAAMLGLLPAAIARGIGSDIQRPLATVVVGGLLSTLVLTLVTLPAVYWLAERLRPPQSAPAAHPAARVRCRDGRHTEPRGCPWTCACC